MSTEQPQHAQGLSQDEKALHMHDLWTQLALDDNRLLSERTSIFLLAGSILFAAFALLSDVLLIIIALPIIGLGLCFLQWVNATGTARSAMFGWDALMRLERDEPALSAFIGKKLAPHVARWRYWVPDQTEQEGRRASDKRERVQNPLDSRLEGKWVKRSWFRKFGPSSVSITYIPLGFALLWIAGGVGAGWAWCN